jgi:membrane associated rhomboid family serine protease
VNALRNLAAFWNLVLLAAVFGTLGGFFYAVFLRKILRARRIANVRERRLLREAAERQSTQS